MMGDSQSEIIERELDRPRGILTQSDRELLLDRSEELSDRARNQRLIRLRRRVRNALMDGAPLRNLDPKDRKLIFHPRDDSEGKLVRGGAALLFRFLYIGLKEAGTDIEAIIEQNAKQAEIEYAREQGEYINPHVKFHVSEDARVDMDGAIQKLQAGDPLSGNEVAAIWESDYEPSEDEVKQLLNSRESDDLGVYGTGVREWSSSKKEEDSVEEK